MSDIFDCSALPCPRNKKSCDPPRVTAQAAARIGALALLVDGNMPRPELAEWRVEYVLLTQYRQVKPIS